FQRFHFTNNFDKQFEKLIGGGRSWLIFYHLLARTPRVKPAPLRHSRQGSGAVEKCLAVSPIPGKFHNLALCEPAFLFVQGLAERIFPRLSSSNICEKLRRSLCQFLDIQGGRHQVQCLKKEKCSASIVEFGNS